MQYSCVLYGDFFFQECFDYDQPVKTHAACCTLILSFDVEDTGSNLTSNVSSVYRNARACVPENMPPPVISDSTGR